MVERYIRDYSGEKAESAIIGGFEGENSHWR
jgi:hypothetical protein